jgi:hypothetical protein
VLQCAKIGTMCNNRAALGAKKDEGVKKGEGGDSKQRSPLLEVSVGGETTSLEYI